MRGVLVPDIAEPFCRQANRQAAAVNESEISANGLSHGRGRTEFIELHQNRHRIAWIIRQEFVEAFQSIECRLRRKDFSLRQTVDVLGGESMRLIEQRWKCLRIVPLRRRDM